VRERGWEKMYIREIRGREKPSERGGVVASERERKRAREKRRKGEEERDIKIEVAGGWEGRESMRSRER